MAASTTPWVAGAPTGSQVGGEILAPITALQSSTTNVALFTGETVIGGPVATNYALFLTVDEATELQMTVARVEHHAAILPGERVLVTGGYGPGTPSPVLRSAEVFSSASTSFAATGDMGTARADHASAPLPDGRVLVTGGLTPQGAGPATIETSESPAAYLKGPADPN